ncbi:MAG: TolC family protein, partial [Sulfurovum sp.]|nr:TolC family protein [Sulfurovum sp.]NNJ45153.1 TolC family protein [Sulfurovum sp.]
LQTIMVYLEIQKANELVKNSEINVQHNEAIYQKVLKAYEAGVSTRSEVSKIQASLSLARSNNMVQKSKLRNAHYNFRRVVGRLVRLKDLKKVNFELKIPESHEKAIMYALEYNPSLLVGDYNIKGAEALYRESKSAFYPQVDLEVSQNYNENYNEFSGADDRFQAMVVLSYNLFKGGADEAARKHKLSKLSQEVSVLNDLRRQVIEGVDLSWVSYMLAQEQIPFLKEYKQQSIETLDYYTKEYKLGERSMLDLISAENDLKKANDELITARYNLLLSKYRILDAMGLTIASIMGGEEEYYGRVGIFTGITSVNEENTYDELVRAMEKDSLPVNREIDGDRIPDSKDVSPNTRDKTKVSPSGRSI